MTGFDSKRRIALDRLDDDDIQIYAQPEGKIMTKDDALTLEALKYAASMGYPSSMLKDMFAPFTIKRNVAMAQPVQEPVAYCYVQKGTSVDILTFDDAPDDAVDGTIFPLYTAPPPRPWVGLTKDDCKGMSLGDKVVAVWADRLLKEKNT